MKKNTWLVLMIISVLWSNHQINGQNPEWVYYTANSGINSLAIDGNNVWVGTSGGLKLFNKLTGRLNHFYPCNCDINALDIRALDFDGMGNVWIGTAFDGIIKFDGAQWTRYNTSNSGLPNNLVSAIDIDQQGNIWIGTGGGGLAKFDNTNWVIYNTSNSGAHSNTISTIEIDDMGNKWVGSFGAGLAKFNGSIWTIFQTSNSGLSNNMISDICIDEQDNIWIATNGGLAKFDGSNWIVYNEINSNIPEDKISAISIDEQGNKWIGTWGGGVAKFDDSQWVIYNDLNSCFVSNYISEIAVDSTGNVWFGEGWTGLVKFDNTNWSIIDVSNSKLPYDNVRAIKMDLSGNKWIGTMGAGLAEFDGKNWILFDSSNSPTAISWISDIAIDNQGNKWIGTKYGGILMFNGISWMEYNISNSGLPSNTVNTICIDDFEKKWIGTQGGGLASFDGVTWTTYNASNSALPTNDVTSIDSDSLGNIWIGTSSGLAKFYGVGWTTYTTSNSGIPSNDILSVAVDIQQNIWVGTYDGGLVKFDGTSWFVFDDTNSNIPSVTVFAVSVDEQNNVWIGGAGLAKFSNNTFTAFGSLGINTISFDLLNNIWMGTYTSGVAVFKEGGVQMDITGNVWDVPGSAPVSDGNVYLYNNTNLTGGYDTVAVTPINPDGSYIFADQANCSFTIFAKPDTISYPDLLPAYLGDTIFWTEADTLVALTPASADTIFCFQKPTNGSGSADLTGNVYSNVNGSNDPVKNTGVVLGNESKGSKSFSYAYTTTDSLGAFAFNNLPLGDYFLIIDYPGIPMDMANNVNRFTLSSSDDSVAVKGYVNPALITLGAPQYIKKTPTAKVSTSVYPNPTSDVLCVEISLAAATEIQFSLTDSRGVVMQKLNNLKLQSGTNNLEINLNNLPSGNYLLSIADRKASKILKVEKVVVRR